MYQSLISNIDLLVFILKDRKSFNIIDHIENSF